MSRRFPAVDLLFAAVSPVVRAGREYPARIGRQTHPQQLVLKMKPGVLPAAVVQAVLRGAAIDALHQHLPDVYLVTIPGGIPGGSRVILAAHPLVDFVEPNRLRHHALDPDSPLDPATDAATAARIVAETDGGAPVISLDVAGPATRSSCRPPSITRGSAMSLSSRRSRRARPGAPFLPRLSQPRHRRRRRRRRFRPASPACSRRPRPAPPPRPSAQRLQQQIAAPGLAATGGVVGQVTDPSGNAIDSAQLNVGGRLFTTDASGLFWLRNLPAGTSSVTISAPGFPDQFLDATVAPGADTPFSVTWGSATEISAASCFRKAARRPTPSCRRSPAAPIVATAVCDADGQYSLWAPGRRRLYLQASHIGSDTTAVSSLTLTAGSTAMVNLAMPSLLGRIAGVVRDAALLPLPRPDPAYVRETQRQHGDRCRRQLRDGQPSARPVLLRHRLGRLLRPGDPGSR